MFFESMPKWFWAIYYLFLISSLTIALIAFKQNNNKTFSILAILFAITIPLIGILNSIERTQGINEFEYLFIQLQKGSLWAIYSILGYLYLFIFYILTFVKSRKIKLVDSNI